MLLYCLYLLKKNNTMNRFWRPLSITYSLMILVTGVMYSGSVALWGIGHLRIDAGQTRALHWMGSVYRQHGNQFQCRWVCHRRVEECGETTRPDHGMQPDVDDCCHGLDWIWEFSDCPILDSPLCIGRRIFKRTRIQISKEISQMDRTGFKKWFWGTVGL